LSGSLENLIDQEFYIESLEKSQTDEREPDKVSDALPRASIA
jgi:hypothetical protein